MLEIVYRCKEDYSYTSTVDESKLDGYEWINPETTANYPGVQGVMMELLYAINQADGVRLLAAIPHHDPHEEEVLVAIPYDQIITVEFKGGWGLI